MTGTANGGAWVHEPPPGAERAGAYLGTEIDGSWWRGYRGKGFFARGNGAFWHDGESFFFRRFLTRRALVIPFDRVVRVETGTSHAGRWLGGRLIVKIVWSGDGHELSSGFVVSRDRDSTLATVRELSAAAGLES